MFEELVRSIFILLIGAISGATAYGICAALRRDKQQQEAEKTWQKLADTIKSIFINAPLGTLEKDLVGKLWALVKVHASRISYRKAPKVWMGVRDKVRWDSEQHIRKTRKEGQSVRAINGIVQQRILEFPATRIYHEGKIIQIWCWEIMAI